MTDSDNGYTRTFPLYIGTPSQRNIVEGKPEASFNIDTRFGSMIVATTQCTNDYCIPIYNPVKSSTAVKKREIEF